MYYDVAPPIFNMFNLYEVCMMTLLQAYVMRHQFKILNCRGIEQHNSKELRSWIQTQLKFRIFI